jgi:hypothetical protein
MMMRRPILATIAISVPAFAIGGAVSRYNLRTTETRWQIAAFVAFAACAETVVASSGPRRASFLRGALNAAVATLAIASVKFHLEPDARRSDAAIVRHVTKTVVKAAADER